jgi:hypothetical protein
VKQSAISPNQLLQELAFVLANDPGKIKVADARALLLDSARAGGGPARIVLAVDDETVKSLRGPPDKARWRVALVAINVEAIRRRESRIVLPGERR